jgi:hypothetical protein
MNTPQDRFEAELRALRPRAPSEALVSSITDALRSHPGAEARREARPRLVSFALALSWGAVATLTIALLWPAPPPHTETGPYPSHSPAVEPGFLTVGSSKTLLGTHDEGIVYLEGGLPARRFRFEYVDTINLLSTDDSRATINVSYPREEIRFVPVQTF